VVRYASPYDIEVLLTILETPEWANDRLGADHAPFEASDVRDFAAAAAPGGGSRRSTRSPRSYQD